MTGIIRQFIAGIVFASLAATAALAVTWEMPTPYGDDSFQTKNIRQFAEDVKQTTGGKLEINVHSGGSLLEHASIKDAVRFGRVPIGEFLLSRLTDENAIFEADSLPFLATDYEAAKDLWKASRASIQKLLEAQGLQVLFSVPWPPQGLYIHRAVTSVNDLKGVKFRTYSSPTERFAQLAGAVPVRIEVQDIPQAFTSGRVQAMITSPSTGVTARAWEFVDHFYNTRAWLPKNIVVVNAEAFRRLDEPTQTAVRNAAAQAEARGWKLSQAETTAAIAVLAAHRMKVTDPGPELVHGLEKIGTTMTADWLERTGVEGKAILDAFGKEKEEQR